MNRILPTTLWFFCLALLAASCSSGPGAAPTIDRNAVQTYVVQTAGVAATQTANAASPTPPPTTRPSETPEPASATPSPLPESSSATATPPATPRVAPTGQAAPGPLIERDDFEQAQFWYTAEADNYRLFYDQGGYRLRSRMSAMILHSVRSRSVEDTAIEVDANPLGAPDGSYWGVVCRYVDDKNYYALLVGVDGLYGIGKMAGGDFQFIEKDTSADESIFKADSNGFMRVRGDCVGETLTLYVNGFRLLQVEDDQFTSGLVGLAIRRAVADDWLDVLFDNYTLSQPGATNE